MNHTIQPCFNQVLVTIHELGNDSDIIIPGESDLKRPYGLIVALGHSVDMRFHIGDKVLFNLGAAIGFVEPSGKYYLIPDQVIVGKYIEEAAPSIVQ